MLFCICLGGKYRWFVNFPVLCLLSMNRVRYFIAILCMCCMHVWASKDVTLFEEVGNVVCVDIALYAFHKDGEYYMSSSIF